MNAARSLHGAGQSLWLDNITRNLVASGELARYIADAAVTGLTSNPAIFDKAISGGHEYDAQAIELARKGLNTEAIFFAVAIDDLRAAAALFKPAWDRSNGTDGWVSLEVSPRLAYDAERTIAEAVALHSRAGIPNLLIKVPGTREGLTAIEELTYRGISVNVTLLFSEDQYLAAAGAYRKGIERRRSAALGLRVPSVASLFVSRWDRATADRLPANLKDELGIALAKQTYRSYRTLLASAPWKALVERGACPQRLLFASTGTKESTKPDTYYVEALAATDTIDTIPQATLDAFVEHGKLGALLSADGGNADDVVARIAAAGVDVPALAATLQTAGAAAFVESWDHLLQSIASKVSADARPTR
ncbi:MAG: transaldolase [Anaerolineaceae bacterium]